MKRSPRVGNQLRQVCGKLINFKFASRGAEVGRTQAKQKRDFIASLADRVLVIQKGRIDRLVTVEELMAQEALV